MKDLLLEIVKTIVDQPDEVQVEEATDETGMTLLRLTVHPDDMGRVIGKEGKLIQALRTLLRVAAVKQGKRVRVELVETGPAKPTLVTTEEESQPPPSEPPPENGEASQ